MSNGRAQADLNLPQRNKALLREGEAGYFKSTIILDPVGVSVCSLPVYCFRNEHVRRGLGKTQFHRSEQRLGTAKPLHTDVNNLTVRKFIWLLQLGLRLITFGICGKICKIKRMLSKMA